MRAPREMVQRLFRAKRQATQLRGRLEAGGCADSVEWIHTMKKLTALETTVTLLSWVLQTDLSPQQAPNVRGAGWSEELTLERIDVSPRLPDFPESLTVFLLRVPADDALGSQPWGAFLSPAHLAQFTAASQHIKTTRMGLVVASEPDEPQGA